MRTWKETILPRQKKELLNEAEKGKGNESKMKMKLTRKKKIRDIAWTLNGDKVD